MAAMKKKTERGRRFHGIDRAFGAVLKELRKEQGLSQEELGFESGYHRTYISLLERGLKSPSLQTIFALAKSLKAVPSTILDQAQRKLAQVRSKKTYGPKGRK